MWLYWAVTARWNRKVIVRKFWLTVILFNARKDYGFIKRNDVKEDILLPIRSSRKSLQPVGNVETVGLMLLKDKRVWRQQIVQVLV
jgi:hypothetical protein